MLNFFKPLTSVQTIARLKMARMSPKFILYANLILHYHETVLIFFFMVSLYFIRMSLMHILQAMYFHLEKFFFKKVENAFYHF